MSTKINAATTPLHVHAKNYRKLIAQLLEQGLVTASQNGVKLTTALKIKIDCKVPLTRMVDGKERSVLAWWIESEFGGSGRKAPFVELPIKPLPLEEQAALQPEGYVICMSCRGKGVYGELAATETTLCKHCRGTGVTRKGQKHE